MAVVIAGVGLLSAVESRPARAAACVTIPAVAHRGGTERYAENSGDAFRQADNLGVASWETDVRFTADNVPVIMHDPDVDRTTTGTGLVADLTYAQIQGFAFDGGQRIPALADIVNDAEVDGAKVFVELKVLPTAEQWGTFLGALASRPAMTTKLVITSFDTATLTAAATEAPAYTRGLIQDVGDVEPAAITPYAHILVKHHNAITSSRMAKWTTGGLTVYSWTVDDTAEWTRMAWYPALAGVITDLPGAYLTWQRARVC
jgi:glycerophosphoryl diester phosphodiesterase